MSDDPSPPDFIETADFPLDESVLKHVPVPSLKGDPSAPAVAGAGSTNHSDLGPGTDLDVDPVAHSEPNSGTEGATLFAEARLLGLEQNATISGEAGPILEPVIQGPPVLTPRPRATGGLRNLLAAGRHHGQPLYRRQSTLAAGVLCILTLVVIVSFPRSDEQTESALQAGSAVPQPAGATVGSNSKSGVDSVGSEGFFRRSKGEAAPDDGDPQAEANVVDASLVEDGDETDAVDTTGEQIPAGPSTAPVATDPPEQTETSVFVGSGLGVTTLPFPATPETPVAPGPTATTRPSTATTRRSIPEPTTPTTEPPTTAGTPATTNGPPPTTATPTTVPEPTVTTGPSSTEPPPPSNPAPTTNPTTNPTPTPTVTTPTTAPPSSGQNTDPKPTVTTPTTEGDDLTEDSSTVPTAVSCGPGVTECPPSTTAP